MKNTKIGRPTEMPKDIVLKLRIDKNTNNQLVYCIEREGKNKSDIVRNAIQEYYMKLKENE